MYYSIPFAVSRSAPSTGQHRSCNRVIAGGGKDRVGARIAEELIVACAARDGVVPALCVDQIVVVAQGWREPAELGCAGLCVVAIVIEEGRENRLER